MNLQKLNNFFVCCCRQAEILASKKSAESKDLEVSILLKRFSISSFLADPIDRMVNLVDRKTQID